MHRPRVFPLLIAAALSANCAAPADKPERKPPPSPLAVPPREPVPVPSHAPPLGHLTGEVPPELIEKMRADLAERLGIGASDATLVRAESVVWPDGSLGCPEPGQFYTQATVPGYLVAFTHEGRTYTYHASKRQFFKLCANAPRPVGAPTK